MANQRQLPHQRGPRPYLYQIPALEGLCDDGRNRRTDSSKHHQVVRPVFYCIVEGFQAFCIITLGSNTEREARMRKSFAQGHSHKQSSRKGTWASVLLSRGLASSQSGAHTVSTTRCGLRTPLPASPPSERPPNLGR